MAAKLGGSVNTANDNINNNSETNRDSGNDYAQKPRPGFRSSVARKSSSWMSGQSSARLSDVATKFRQLAESVRDTDFPLDVVELVNGPGQPLAGAHFSVCALVMGAADTSLKTVSLYFVEGTEKHGSNTREAVISNGYGTTKKVELPLFPEEAISRNVVSRAIEALRTRYETDQIRVCNVAVLAASVKLDDDQSFTRLLRSAADAAKRSALAVLDPSAIVETVEEIRNHKLSLSIRPFNERKVDANGNPIMAKVAINVIVSYGDSRPDKDDPLNGATSDYLLGTVYGYFDFVLHKEPPAFGQPVQYPHRAWLPIFAITHMESEELVYDPAWMMILLSSVTTLANNDAWRWHLAGDGMDAVDRLAYLNVFANVGGDPTATSGPADSTRWTAEPQKLQAFLDQVIHPELRIVLDYSATNPEMVAMARILNDTTTQQSAVRELNTAVDAITGQQYTKTARPNTNFVVASTRLYTGTHVENSQLTSLSSLTALDVLSKLASAQPETAVSWFQAYNPVNSNDTALHTRLNMTVNMVTNAKFTGYVNRLVLNPEAFAIMNNCMGEYGIVFSPDASWTYGTVQQQDWTNQSYSANGFGRNVAAGNTIQRGSGYQSAAGNGVRGSSWTPFA